MRRKSLIIPLVPVLLAGCAPTRTVGADALSHDGTFVLPDVEWGVSRAEAEERLGYPVDRFAAVVFGLTAENDPNLDIENAILTPQSENCKIKLENYTGTAAYQFREGELVYAGIYFRDETPARFEEIRDGLLNKLTETYGEAQPPYGDVSAEAAASILAQMETYEWIARDGSRLTFVATYDKERKTIRTVTVGTSAVWIAP